MGTLARTLQAFFTDRLIRQRQASLETIAAYRTSLRLLLVFAAARTGKAPSRLDLADLDPHSSVFSSPTSRPNAPRASGLATPAWPPSTPCSATRSTRRPENAAVIQRVLAMPPKRFDQALVTYLTHAEVDALLAAPDQTTWTGRRDRALLALACQTGLRASELTGLTVGDVHLGAGAHVSCLGKGRRQRIAPLTTTTVRLLRSWLAEREGSPADVVFPTGRGTRLSHDALARLVAKHAATAALSCPSLRHKRVTPHSTRHSAAMALVNAGVDAATVALWLGHQSLTTTSVYVHADLALKERALARTAPRDAKAQRRYQPTDALLAFLDSL